jgi:virulence factor Mce-like protein
MGRRASGSQNSLVAGATTVLVAIVAVLLAYNANAGLPFVPVYELNAELPDAANLVKGAEVRAGGTRVGQVSKIEPVPHSDRAPTARVTLALDKSLEPLRTTSKVVVRSRSALGLKYVELAPGATGDDLPAGSKLAIRQASPRPVELDQVLDTFDERTREGARRTLDGLGSGLAGRGADLNTAIAALPPLLSDLEPVAANLSDPGTRIDRLVSALGRTTDELAPVSEAQARLFVNLDTTFGALADVARPSLQQTISKTPPALATGTSEFPRWRPFLGNAQGLFRELKPGLAALRSSAPALADAVDAGPLALRRTSKLSPRLADVFDALAEFSEEPLVPIGLRRLAQTVRILRPTVSFLTPAQTRCNYVSLWFRNVSSLLSEGDANGTWQRFIIIAAPTGPNSEGGPSSQPADGPGVDNHLHSNPYPNTAAPGQPRECEAGNEPFRKGTTTIGNVAGRQSATTEGKP